MNEESSKGENVKWEGLKKGVKDDWCSYNIPA